MWSKTHSLNGFFEHKKNDPKKMGCPMSTLQGTHTYPTFGKENQLQKCLGMGYVSSQEGKMGGPRSMSDQYQQGSPKHNRTCQDTHTLMTYNEGVIFPAWPLP